MKHPLSIHPASALLISLLFSYALIPLHADPSEKHSSSAKTAVKSETISTKELSKEKQRFISSLVAAARERVQHKVVYDPSYFTMEYPGGDVPADRGVCVDVIIRAYRKVGVDLQKEVHEDMTAHFNQYPDRWGLSKTDANIDHRRVPNLMTFFTRKGESLEVTDDPGDYEPGDLVLYDIGWHGLTHIAIVVDKRSTDGLRPLIVHNNGRGPKMEDCLFDWEIIGRYRYCGPELEATKTVVSASGK